MRWMADALRGAWTALAAHPGMFASVTLAVAGLNVVAPVALLSAVRKPLDFYTFNPWLKRLPEYIASDDAPLVEKLAKLADLALFWVSAGSTYGGAEWGFAVDVTDVGRTLLVSALFGLYFALWRRYRDLALGGAARAAHRGGLAGAAATASRRSPSSSCLFSPSVTSGAVHALQEKMAENDCLELEARHDRIA